MSAKAKRPPTRRAKGKGRGDDPRDREVGARLITLRRMRGFETGSDAARAVGIPVKTYLALERGERGRQFRRVLEILRVMDCSPDEFDRLEPGTPNGPGRPERF